MREDKRTSSLAKSPYAHNTLLGILPPNMLLNFFPSNLLLNVKAVLHNVNALSMLHNVKALNMLLNFCAHRARNSSYTLTNSMSSFIGLILWQHKTDTAEVFYRSMSSPMDLILWQSKIYTVQAYYMAHGIFHRSNTLAT